MNIELLHSNTFTANCYILTDGDTAAVIDPGIYYSKAAEVLKQYKKAYILLTHCHYDHILGVYKLQQETGAEVVISFNDSVGLMEKNGVSLVKESGNFLPTVTPDILVNDEDKLPFGDDFIEVIATPGHTTGSVCYKYKNNLFSGDTLFYENIGRTDLPTGHCQAILFSIRKLQNLPDDTVVYPGHEKTTTIKHEKEFNPYMKRNQYGF